MLLPSCLNVYGDTSFRGECPVEGAEQVTFFSQLRARHPKIGAIAIHPRNEGKRTMYQAQRHKAEGMTAGAADIVIPGCPALVIELKRKDHTKSTWQPGQLAYLEACQEAGAKVCVALGWEAAMQAVEEWMQKSSCTDQKYG